MLRKQIADILNDGYYFLFASIKGVSVADDESEVIIRDVYKENIKFNKVKQSYSYSFSLFCPIKHHLFYMKTKKIEKFLRNEGYQMEVCENELQFRKG